MLYYLCMVVINTSFIFILLLMKCWLKYKTMYYKIVVLLEKYTIVNPAACYCLLLLSFYRHLLLPAKLHYIQLFIFSSRIVTIMVDYDYELW